MMSDDVKGMRRPSRVVNDLIDQAKLMRGSFVGFMLTAYNNRLLPEDWTNQPSSTEINSPSI